MRSFIFIFVLIYLFSSCSNTEDPTAKNVELQSLEIEIFSKIDEGDKAGALNLLKNLSHPSDKEWKEKQKLDAWDHFLEGGNKYYTYNEWWSERRESLRIEIGKINDSKNTSSNKKSNSSELEYSIDETVYDDKQINSKVEVPINYIGLYVFQYENGSTQFYKIFKDTDNVFSSIYQDNISGNVRIENYVVEAFDETTGKIKLKSKKDKKSIVELKFSVDSESSNGLKLVDVRGLVYSYVQ
jgi:hypothetical protein